MNPIRAIRRLACILAGLAVAFAVAGPAALASASPGPAGAAPQNLPPPPPGWNKHPPLPDLARAHATLADGMPGWQITLIAVAAAVLAAAIAVLLYRARAARRHVTATAA